MEKKKAEKKIDKLKMDRIRTDLSIRRTKLSCERALLAYISTACVFVSLAFGYSKVALFDSFDAFVITMFIIGGFFLFVGFVEYFLVMARIKIIYKDFNVEDKYEEITEEE